MKTISLIFCIAFAMSSYGQKVTLKENNEPLLKVLHDLEKLTSYQFFFSDITMKSAKNVSIDVKNENVNDVLDMCFKGQPLTYTVSGNAVMIRLKEDNLKKNENPSITLNNINGHVTDSLGNSLTGASVVVQGSEKGTSTDNKGNFTLARLNENTILLISFTGYTSKQIQVKQSDPILVILNKSVSPLDEIQVIAYGTTTKRLSTGNISTVTSKEIERQPVSNALLTMQGLVPGTFVTTSSGYADEGVNVIIRGLNSLSNGSYPLFIIDGVPFANIQNKPISGPGGNTGPSTISPFSFINPSDIESISILKDADATAIYGSRGANGVILITTKKGKVGKVQVEFNIQNGWGKAADKMKLLNTRQYLDMRYEAFKNDGASPNPNADYDLTLWDTTRYTDWQKVLLGGTAQYTDITGTVSGGSLNTQFLVSSDFNRQTTILPADFGDERGSVHFNINNISPNRKFKLLFSGLYTVENNHLGLNDFGSMAAYLPPDAPPLYNQDGTLNWAPTTNGGSSWPEDKNPAAELLSQQKITTNNLVSNSTLSYEIIPGFEIKCSMGYTNLQINQFYTIPFTAFDPSTLPSRQRFSYFINSNVQSWNIEPQLTYTKNISKGIFSALMGASLEQDKNIGLNLYASGFSSDQSLQNIQAATSITATSTVNSIYRYNAGFGRINYNWENKYVLNFSGRRDGSSRFGPANQFHNFWATGGAWIFSKEDFIQKHFSFVSFGKLRASYGSTGSDQVGDYSYLDLYGSLPNISALYQGVGGIYPGRIYTPDLEWEETRKLEAGLELGFFKDRINIDVVFYRNRSTNQLTQYALSDISGFTTIKKNLDALIQNKGWEFELKTVNVKSNNFNWSSSFNISFNNNKLVSGAAGLSPFYLEEVGHSPYSARLYHFIGVDPITGVDQFADSHGNPTFNPNPLTDKYFFDTNPKFYGGFQNALSYRDFQLDFLFQFVNQRGRTQPVNFIAGTFGYGVGNQPVSVLDRWQKPGDVTNIQRFSQNISLVNTANYAAESDEVYGDASYIRLKNVSLSWHLPKMWNTKMHLQNASIYIHAQNLLTITKYQGLDPETQNIAGLPPLKIITLGIQASL